MAFWILWFPSIISMEHIWELKMHRLVPFKYVLICIIEALVKFFQIWSFDYFNSHMPLHHGSIIHYFIVYIVEKIISSHG